MKKLLFIILVLFPLWSMAMDSDSIFVKETRTPVLLEREDNVLFYVKIMAKGGEIFNSLTLDLKGCSDIGLIHKLKLYYGGTEGHTAVSAERFAPVNYISNVIVGKTKKADPSYSRLMAESAPKNEIVLRGEQILFPGVNYFWISIKMKNNTPLSSKISAKISDINIDGFKSSVSYSTPDGIEHLMGVGVRHAGDEGSISYRIPGLVTTNRGTLLGVYDVRYNSSTDLQEHIDIGLSRSTDGGQTWEKMRFPLAFGEYGGLPSAQNGVGDPSILVDTHTNNIWVMGLWIFGKGNTHIWQNSLSGNSPYRTGQLVLSKSTDDGKTWSKHINITSMVKNPSWKLLLQGPGRGITTSDGTLVFPIQFKDSLDMPHAGLMYSKDRGETWIITNPARSNTTEAQVAELSDGTLMLNMRDNRGGSRAVMVTSDLGISWKEHTSSRKSLREPVCQASLISVKASDNILGKDLLIFSNPDVVNMPRRNITIKISLDGGCSWLSENQILIDDGENYGYSCLTMIDRETVGILYEGSTALITFQAIKLKDIVSD